MHTYTHTHTHTHAHTHTHTDTPEKNTQKKKTINNNKKKHTPSNQKVQKPTEITVISETNPEAIPQIQTSELLLATVVTKKRFDILQNMLDTTPETLDSSIPNTNDVTVRNELIPQGH